MMIKEIMLTHYGKFHNSCIELGPGLNIIYGDNEAGKSTVHTFIRCMLFGMKRGRGRGAASDVYSKYKPWEGAAYEGTLVFEYQGKNYRLYRNFLTTEAACHLTELASGREIALVHGAISDLIPGLTEENYCQSINMVQKVMAVDAGFALELQSHAANLGSTGDAHMHLGRALAYLKQEQKNIAAKRKALQLEEIARQQENLRDRAASIQNMQTDLQRQKLLRADLTAQMSDCQEALAKIHTQTGVMKEKQRQLENEEVTLKNAQPQVLSAEPLPTGDEKNSGGMPTGKLRPAAAVMAVCAALDILAIANRAVWPLALLGAILAISTAGLLAAAGMWLWCCRKRHRAAKEAAPTLERSGDILDARWQALRQKQVDLSRESELLAQRGRQWQHRQQMLAADLENCRQRIEKILWTQEQQAELISRIDALEMQLDDQRIQAKHYDEESAAAAMAQKLIEDLSEEIHAGFGSRLTRSVEDFMNGLSGHTRRFFVNRDFKISVDNDKNYVDMNRLSSGTIDQLYFSVRIAAAGLLFGDWRPPLIADDIFAFYDDLRLKCALRWLMEHFDGQILLFSCHHREADILDQMDYDYNYVNLN